MGKKKIKIESEETGDKEAGDSAEIAGDSENGIDHKEELAASRSGRDADFSVFENEDGGSGNNSGNNSGDEGSSSQVAELKAELRKSKENYLRALADLDNFKKRTIKERSELLKYQGERVFIDLLEVIDNFDRALENLDSENSDTEAMKSEEAKQFLEGITLIHRMFLQVLEKWEVKGKSAVGEPFDPNHHEAISQMPSAEYPAGTVINELEKAYSYKDKLIRPAKVVVSVAAAEPESAEQDGSNDGDLAENDG